MQCPSCQFENMPGMKRCARCQAMLSMATIDVQPPRASKRDKAIPLGIRNRWTRFRIAMGDAIHQFILPGQREVGFQGSAWDWFCLLVGGLNQFRRGEASGTIWLGAWVFMLVLSLLLFGTDLGTIALGSLFAIHVASIGDLFFRQAEDWSTRVRFTLVAVVALGLCYFLALRSIGSWVQPFQFAGITQDFQPEDVLWFAPGADCTVGDIAFYHIPTRTIPGQLGGANALFRVEGPRVSRLVANEGQSVAWTAGKIWVDGQESPWQPGPTMSQFQPFEILVPGDSVFLLPENLIVNGRTAQLAQGDVGVVPKRAILGRVFFRSYPWWQMRWYPAARD
jgi:hypothetical protein